MHAIPLFPCALALHAALVSACLPAASAAPAPAPGHEAALAFIARQKPPVFAPGHQLPPLTLWRQVHPDVQKRLTEAWGYAWYGAIAGADTEEQLARPDSPLRKMLQPSADDPARYPLHVCIRPAGAMGEFARKFGDDAFLRDGGGKLILRGKAKVWSPVAPDHYWEEIADYHVDLLRAIRRHAPIAVVTNGGEYGFNATGHIGPFLEQDPRVAAARGDQPWHEFLADRKAHYNRILRERLHRTLPDVKLYILYKDTAGGHSHRRAGESEWARWGFVFRPGVSDLPSAQCYLGQYTTGFTGDNDMLSQFLNARAQEIAAGAPLAYYWVTAGWLKGEDREKLKEPIAPTEGYTGLLKCLYAGGTLGNVAGYFGSQPDAVAAEAERTLPQFLALGHAHALFSHLEEFLRSGDLLPGPDRHRWSTDLPAYEFPTGHPHTRVLVRRHTHQPRWLVVAWAADGVAREVRVTIPELGEVTLRARFGGSVYVVTKDAGGKMTAELQDPDPMDPTGRWRK